jgi:hypothetical protein
VAYEKQRELKLSIMVKKAKSFKDYLAKIEDPKYQGGSWDLPENASPLEKSKYDLCENILAYKQDNKLTIKKLSQQLNLSEAETEDVTLSH